MNIFRLGSTFDTSRIPRLTSFSEVVARVTGEDPVRAWASPINSAPPLGTVWAINLTGWQAPANSPGMASSPRNSLGLSSCQARIVLQSDGANETIVVDYPCSGTSFCVAAQTVEVSVVGTTPDPTIVPPILGAYLSPAAGVTGVGDAPGRCATLTTPAHEFSSGGVGFTFDVPVRARGFLPITHVIANGSGSPPSFSFSQFMPGLGTLRDTLWSVPTGSFVLDSVIALHPLAQTVTVTPNGVPGDETNLSMMWVLQTCQ